MYILVCSVLMLIRRRHPGDITIMIIRIGSQLVSGDRLTSDTLHLGTLSGDMLTPDTLYLGTFTE